MSSNFALQAARRLLNAAKGGHTGTLDPLATGLLPLCFGEATKFSAELLNADKRYTARVRLGITTDTADAEGQVLSETPVNVSAAQLVAVLAEFRGEIRQIPPMYSALKRDGKPLYAYAREGIELEREARSVTIHELNLLNFEAEHFEIDVLCSKGSYIRTLAADIGQRLGCGAHLASLRRTAIGRLTIESAVSLEAIERVGQEQRLDLLQAPDALLCGWPELVLSPEQAGKIGHGQSIRWDSGGDGLWRLYSDCHQFLGVGRLDGEGLLRPERLVACDLIAVKKAVSM